MGVTKDMAATELAGAVRKVALDGAYVTASLAESVVRLLNGSAEATPQLVAVDRPRTGGPAVLRRVAAGHRLTEMANALHLSVKTVSAPKTRIQEKLQVSARPHWSGPRCKTVGPAIPRSQARCARARRSRRQEQSSHRQRSNRGSNRRPI